MFSNFRQRFKSSVVQCYFCHESFSTIRNPAHKKQHFAGNQNKVDLTCPFCLQYNGFDESTPSGYDCPPPAMFSQALNPARFTYSTTWKDLDNKKSNHKPQATLHISPSLSPPSSVLLCDTCQRNNQLWLLARTRYLDSQKSAQNNIAHLNQSHHLVLKDDNNNNDDDNDRQQADDDDQPFTDTQIRELAAIDRNYPLCSACAQKVERRLTEIDVDVKSWKLAQTLIKSKGDLRSWATKDFVHQNTLDTTPHSFWANISFAILSCFSPGLSAIRFSAASEQSTFVLCSRLAEKFVFGLLSTFLFILLSLLLLLVPLHLPNTCQQSVLSFHLSLLLFLEFYLCIRWWNFTLAVSLAFKNSFRSKLITMCLGFNFFIILLTLMDMGVHGVNLAVGISSLWNGLYYRLQRLPPFEKFQSYFSTSIIAPEYILLLFTLLSSKILVRCVYFTLNLEDLYKHRFKSQTAHSFSRQNVQTEQIPRPNQVNAKTSRLTSTFPNLISVWFRKANSTPSTKFNNAQNLRTRQKYYYPARDDIKMTKTEAFLDENPDLIHALADIRIQEDSSNGITSSTLSLFTKFSVLAIRIVTGISNDLRCFVLKCRADDIHWIVALCLALCARLLLPHGGGLWILMLYILSLIYAIYFKALQLEKIELASRFLSRNYSLHDPKSRQLLKAIVCLLGLTSLLIKAFMVDGFHEMSRLTRIVGKRVWAGYVSKSSLLSRWLHVINSARDQALVIWTEKKFESVSLLLLFTIIVLTMAKK